MGVCCPGMESVRTLASRLTGLDETRVFLGDQDYPPPSRRATHVSGFTCLFAGAL